ncbi:MAG: hypothetical protein QM731_28050 [Chitinophagaceae bacterium]
MQFLSLQPFVPSGKDFEKSKQFFTELGFNLLWSDGGYAGFEKDGCRFILQHFDKDEFAQNFMVTVGVTSAEEFRNSVLEKQLPEKFGIRIGQVTQQSYGKEVNIIDIAGVCWHFVE